MNPDFDDLVEALLAVDARFLIVGAHAMAVHGVPRATGDLDIWIARDDENAARITRALLSFGAPVDTLGITEADLTKRDIVIQIGVPPRRIDLLTGLSGVTFDEAWNRRVSHDFGGQLAPFLDRESLVRNKRATGRLKDLADLEAMGELREERIPEE